MHIKVFGKIKPNATIICGFPSFGLIGTISTEFLINHLGAVEVAVFHYEEIPPTLAIHQGKIVKPMAVYYDKSHNIVLINIMVSTKGVEWKIADCMAKFAKEINAKRILNLEGVAGGPEQKGNIKLYYVGDHKFAEFGVEHLKESILLGVVAGLLQRVNNVSCIFASTESKLPDSKASAKIIEVVDKYLNLNVDYKPLLKQAELFQDKLQKIVERSNEAIESVKKKDLSYVG